MILDRVGVMRVRVHNLQFYFWEGENFERTAFNLLSTALWAASHFTCGSRKRRRLLDPPSWIATSLLY